MKKKPTTSKLSRRPKEVPTAEEAVGAVPSTAAAEEGTEEPSPLLPVSPSEEAIGQPVRYPSEELVGSGGFAPTVCMEKRIVAPPKPKSPVFNDGILPPGMLIVMLEQGRRTVFRVVYVNNSRAWCVPPGSAQHEGVGISSTAYVEVVDPKEAETKAAEWAKEAKAQYPGKRLSDNEETGPMASSAAIPVADKSNRDKNKAAKATLAAKRGAAGIPLRGAAAKSAATKKDKPPKTVRSCGCGCGEETTGYFAPGHDARWHGWMKKLADGRLTPGSPEVKKVVGKLDLKKTKTGFVPTLDYKGDKYVAKH